MLILGGGIAGLALAYFNDNDSILIEKELILGGLSRSFYLNGIAYDVGPHIIFSKYPDILTLHHSLVPVNKLRRANKILYKGRLIKYPFENDLAALTETERDYCLTEFLHNPYEDYPAENMQQFFLKTFGEGITRLYLQPYNEKIWKMDPSCLDTQMVSRIPKPPKADVIKSAQGIPTEGYLHQLYFTYPQAGGFQALINAYAKKISHKTKIFSNTVIQSITRENKEWVVKTDHGTFQAKILMNTIPLPALFQYINAPDDILKAVYKLKYNSLHIIAAQFKKDNMGDHLAFYVPDQDIIFHRVTKLNFLGSAYCLPNGGTTLLLEITFRAQSYLSKLNEQALKERILFDLEKLNLAEKKELIAIEVKTFEYGYVIYDLPHRMNTDKVLNYLRAINIWCCGRFAEFEYMNTDQVVYRAKELTAKIKGM